MGSCAFYCGSATGVAILFLYIKERKLVLFLRYPYET
jgi:hypothetical protein